MPVTRFSPGGCGCSPGCSATITGNVKGCNSLNAQGITVEAHDSTSGGTLLGSTTTNSSGNYTLNITGATAGNSVVVVFAHTRFTTATTTLTHTSGSTSSTTWKCGGTSTGVNKTLSPAAGYHCYAVCAFPIADTLNFTDTYFGAGTLTWVVGTIWQGTLSHSYGGCGLYGGGCVPQTVTLTFVLGGPIFTWQNLGSGCPDDTGAFTNGPPNYGPTSVTCYIPGVSAFSAVMNWGGGACVNTPSAQTQMFCCNSGTFPSHTSTITE